MELSPAQIFEIGRQLHAQGCQFRLSWGRVRDRRTFRCEMVVQSGQSWIVFWARGESMAHAVLNALDELPEHNPHIKIAIQAKEHSHETD